MHKQQPPRVVAKPSNSHSLLDSLARPVFTFSTRANTGEDRHAARKQTRYGLKRPPAASWNNFRFAEPTQRIDWKQMALLNLPQLKEQRDVRCLQRCLRESAYGNVVATDLQVVSDSTITKYIGLTQLTVQYLLHRNNAMDELVIKLGKIASSAKRALRQVGQPSFV